MTLLSDLQPFALCNSEAFQHATTVHNSTYKLLNDIKHRMKFCHSIINWHDIRYIVYTQPYRL